MATINPPAEWSTDQALLPESLVDYFIFNLSLTEGEPISVASGTSPTEESGAILEFTTLAPGSGYKDGSYNGVDFVNITGSGSGATLDLQWLNGDLAFAICQNGGTGYRVGDRISVDDDDVGGTGSGLSFQITKVLAA